MSETLDAVKRLVAAGDARISEHGYDELANDRILARDILNRVDEAVVVEGYPDLAKGPAVLVLKSDAENQPIHVVFGAFQKDTRVRRFW